MYGSVLYTGASYTHKISVSKRNKISDESVLFSVLGRIGKLAEGRGFIMS